MHGFINDHPYLRQPRQQNIFSTCNLFTRLLSHTHIHTFTSTILATSSVPAFVATARHRRPLTRRLGRAELACIDTAITSFRTCLY